MASPNGNQDQTTKKHRVSSTHPLLIALISIVVVIVAVFYVRGWENEKLLKDFNFSANTYRQLLEGRLRDIIIELDSAKRFYQGSKFVDRAEFSSFISKAISKSDEIVSISWVPRISGDQRRILETSKWIGGLNGRSIHDPDPVNPNRHDKPSPPRAIHFPILYAEPGNKMDEWIGFDLASNPTILTLLEQARDEDVIVPITHISSPHLLTGRNANRESFVILIQPVYRSNGPLQTIKQRRDRHLGFLILQYDIGIALETAISNSEPIGLDIYIVDVEAEDGNEIVFHHRSRLVRTGAPLTFSELWEIPEFIHTSSLNVSGRQWKLMTVPLALYYVNHQQYQSWGVLAFGLALSSLFSYVMFSNYSRTAVIRETVRSQTKELSRTNEALQYEAEQRKSQLRELDFQKFALDEHAIVSITDVRGNIIYANEKFCEISEYSLEELDRKNHRIIKSDEHPPEFYADMWKTISHGKVWQGEIKNSKKNGGHYWVMSTIVPSLDEKGKPFQYISIRTDITERKDAEIKAMTASRTKSELMANMSHELRTPLNAIIGFSDSIKQETFGPLGNDKYREYLEDIHQSGQHLLDLINDILDVSAVEAGALELQEENLILADVAETAVHIIRPRTEKGKVTISSKIDPELHLIYADGRRVKQILLNLLSNAVKFTPKAGEVILSAWFNDDGSLAVSVADTGIGMNDEDVTKALSTFGQVDSGLDRKHEGTGLGLPLTKGLMELHGGTLEVKSDKGKGTIVTITFPRERVIQNI